MPRPCLVIRVFTRDGKGGNHLGVVTELEGLDTAKMQLIANDLGFSETVFIDQHAGDVPRVRIFTPELELPFAGHPLLQGGEWRVLRLRERRLAAYERYDAGQDAGQSKAISDHDKIPPVPWFGFDFGAELSAGQCAVRNVATIATGTNKTPQKHSEYPLTVSGQSCPEK